MENLSPTLPRLSSCKKSSATDHLKNRKTSSSRSNSQHIGRWVAEATLADGAAAEEATSLLEMPAPDLIRSLAEAVVEVVVAAEGASEVADEEPRLRENHKSLMQQS